MTLKTSLAISVFAGLSLALAAGVRSHAQETPRPLELPHDPAPKPSKYPLRLHVLASDDVHVTVRMQPQYDSASIPDMSSGVVAGGGGGGSTSSYTSFGGDNDFSGKGRGDLVTPPQGTQGLSFSYDGCPRIRVLAGFQGLQARWKTPGKKLEVLLPSEGIPVDDKPLPKEKCTLKVTMHDFVYLKVRTGALVQVSQEDYWKKPALRMFLSGGVQKLEVRPARTPLKAEPVAVVPPPPPQ